MKTKTKEYLFLGLPNSGKTTYFSLMADAYQSEGAKNKNFRFLFMPTKTIDSASGVTNYAQNASNYIDSCISQINQQKWPKKTLETIQCESCIDEQTARFIDYPGESYAAAFCEDENPSSQMQEMANEIKRKIATASGIVLLVDTDMMFNGDRSQKIRQSLEGLFQCIHDVNPMLRLALLYSKLELFGDKHPDFEQLFQTRYKNAYQWLLCLNFKTFQIYPLGTFETDENGGIIPPRTRNPRGCLEPIHWILQRRSSFIRTLLKECEIILSIAVTLISIAIAFVSLSLSSDNSPPNDNGMALLIFICLIAIDIILIYLLLKVRKILRQ